MLPPGNSDQATINCYSKVPVFGEHRPRQAREYPRMLVGRQDDFRSRHLNRHEASQGLPAIRG
jgi:hypothetical protein